LGAIQVYEPGVVYIAEPAGAIKVQSEDPPTPPSALEDPAPKVLIKGINISYKKNNLIRKFKLILI
jgi:hypothetical protein